MTIKKPEQITALSLTHTSVDCVVFGFDGKNLKVLLIKRSGKENGVEFSDMKLPGSIINLDEDLDEAANRVLKELTGLTTITLTQFKAFGSKDRTKDPKDVHWLQTVQNMVVDRIVTIAYVGLLKLTGDKFKTQNELVVWEPVDSIPTLAFDHNIIIKDGLDFIRTLMRLNPEHIFKLLPKKFTEAQFRRLYEVVSGKSIDVRNFSKKMKATPYIIATGEREKGVTHRAAMYYKFDKTIYSKTLVK